MWWENPDVYVHAPDRKALIFDATFSAPDLDTRCLLDRLGLTKEQAQSAIGYAAQIMASENVYAVAAE